MKNISVSVICILLILAASTQARQLQTPAEFLGYELGDRFTPHYRVVQYYEHIAENSPRVELEYYGETNEFRPLLVAYVSSEENIRNLEEIRLNNLRLTGLVEGTPGDNRKAITWLSYNVHGNESSSMEAAMETIYRFANPDDAERSAWLENTVLVMDPAINPDGRDRYMNYYTQASNRVANPHVFTREHIEPWPGGRFNHYLFDLNRDWAWITQVESRQRLEIYHRWMPHVHVDYHEMGYNSPYYFAPASQPYHEDITQWQRDFQFTIGKSNARYFDERNRVYYTREVFDLLYPSYGDSYPTYNGAIGMTYEQGGGGPGGRAVITDEGDTLTLARRIDNQINTGMGTVEAVAGNYRQVIQEFEKYYSDARNNPKGEYKTYILKGDGNRDHLRALLELLDAHKIQYGQAPQRRNVRGYDYSTGENGTFTLTDNDVVISAYQPKSVLAKVLLEPKTVLVDSLTYDITAWALPYVYGLQGFATSERINPAGSYTFTGEPPVAGDLARPYAYVMHWTSFPDVKFLAALLEAGVSVRHTLQPFRMNGRDFDRGSLIITRKLNDDGFDLVVRRLAAEHGRTLYTTPTGFMEQHPDIGSNNVRLIKKPSVGILSGDGVSATEFGAVWHYFDQDLEYQTSVVPADRLNEQVLQHLDVLIMPDGNYSNSVGTSGLNSIRNWVRNGGRVIAIRNAVNFFAGKDGFSDLKQKEDTEDEDASPEDHLRMYGERRQQAISNTVEGAIFRIRLDNTHPLGFGMPDHYYTLKTGTNLYGYLENGWNVGALRPGSHRSGFVGANIREKLDDTLVFGVQNMGRGQMIYMVDTPIFRQFWYNGKMLLGNAVFSVGN